MWIDIVDINGNKLGAGPIRTLEWFSSTVRLNRAGEFALGTLPTDKRTEELLLDESAQRYVMGWDIINGQRQFIGGGPIHNRKVVGSPNGWKLEVSGPDMLGELTYYTINASFSGSGNTSLNNLLNLLPPAWSALNTGTTPNFVAKFANETMLQAMTNLAEKVNAYFFPTSLGNDVRRLTWRYETWDTGIVASNTVDPVAVERNDKMCLITGISESHDSWEVINTALVYGAGIGETRLNMSAATTWPNGSSLSSSYSYLGQTYSFNRAANTITNTTSVASYGTRKMQLPFKDVRPLSNSDADVQAAANYLVLAAVHWLAKHSKVERFYDISVAGLRQLVSPSETIRAQARQYVDGRKPININTQLMVLEATRRWEASQGHFTTGLKVASVNRWPASSVEVVVDTIGKSIIMESHPQMGPNVDTITYREHLDDGHNAHLYFFLGEEVTSVNQVVVRFRVDPLRSTVRTVGGSASVDVAASLPNHQHNITVAPGTSPRAITGTVVGSNIVLNYGGTNDGDKQLKTNASDGGGATITATVDLSSAITATYGVFDDSSPGTYLATDLWYQVNGGGWVQINAGNVIPGAVGWYGFDITAQVASPITGRPLSKVINVEFRAPFVPVGKKAQITAQIQTRTTIQSIAVF